ncbi:hypothetical protein KY362_06475, partial [Candidatus Woesearchaeota archaeon]|nr:hypothetical protein [Candidatus Woesearchaeota archaeon]
GFKRTSPYGDAGSKAEPVGRLVSAGVTSAVRTEPAGAEPQASGRARPPKTQPAERSRPWAVTKVIQEYDTRISQLAAKQRQLRRTTYFVFGLRVAEEIYGLLPECSDFTDNDRDGTADYDGVVYKGPPLRRVYSRDSGCSSPEDRTEGEHICEGVIYALDYLRTSAEQTPAADANALAEACHAYEFLAESNRAEQCVDRYALIAKEVRQLAKESVRLREEIRAYCEQHDCQHHVPAVFLERHLGDLLESGRELYKGIKLREVQDLQKAQGPDWQTLCEGISST